ncbi:MAG: SRPBCC domain-containing protein [Phycisphaerales bacterium]|nr:SRPBCC domain-containing protein [Phycisphaerales bacterium]
MTAAVGEEVQSVHIVQQIEINAPMRVAFDAILEELGPSGMQPDGSSMNWKLEAWPGGRWYRDLGEHKGHLWGHVQVIKPPTLLEIAGPMFMSFAVANHVQYRLSEEGTRTRVTLTHTGVGLIPQDLREGMTEGWGMFMNSIRERAEGTAKH